MKKKKKITKQDSEEKKKGWNEIEMFFFSKTFFFEVNLPAFLVCETTSARENKTSKERA